MSPTLTTSGAVALKAGANVSTAIVDANYNSFITKGEAYVNDKTRINWNKIYPTLSGAVALLIDDVVSSHAGMACINYDMSGYTSRAEAQTMLDFNYTRVTDGMAELKDKFTTDFMKEEVV